MDKILETVCTQVPSLVVLVMVVNQFLNAQKQTREANAAERAEFISRFDEIHKENVTARAESRAVLDKVANAMTELSLAVATCPLKLHNKHQ